jgi:hypothetical protein
VVVVNRGRRTGPSPKSFSPFWYDIFSYNQDARAGNVMIEVWCWWFVEDGEVDDAKIGRVCAGGHPKSWHFAPIRFHQAEIQRIMHYILSYVGISGIIVVSILSFVKPMLPAFVTMLFGV